MKIGSICTRRVATIDSANTPIQAAALMREHHVGALVVITRTPELRCAVIEKSART